ncbi:KR domain-containing protein, partial [Kitasatospora putterlickiae]|uniref:KR domain-containing protein n=1 Tax=Kitasatospora putterlickiae TaxID=221725 RepID=UPI0031CF1616
TADQPREPAPAPDLRLDLDLAGLRAGLQRQDVDAWYDRLWREGVETGAAAATVTELWRSGDDLLARLRREETGDDLQPLLETAFTLAAAFHAGRATPAALDRLTVEDRLPAEVWAHVRHRADGSFTVALLSPDGAPLAAVEGLRLLPVTPAETSRRAAAALRHHTLGWQPLPARSGIATMAAPQGSWLVFGTDPEQVRGRRARLALEGVTALAVLPDAGAAAGDPDTLLVAPELPDSLEQLWAQLRRREITVAGLLLYGPDPAGAGGEPLAEGEGVSARHGFAFLQGFLREFAAQDPAVVLCSTGALAPRSPESVAPRPEQSLLTALARTVTWEHPNLPCVQVDLEPGAEEPDAGTLVRHAVGVAGSGLLAVRGGRWYEARLQEAPLPGEEQEGVKIRPDAGYLVVGGGAAEASAVVDWLVGQGARAVAVAGPEPVAVDDERVRPLHVEGDLGDPAAVAALLERVDRELPPLRGVVHLADPAPHAPLDGWEWADFSTAVGRGVRGPWQLHRQTWGLDFLVFSSPVTSLAGHPGEAVATAVDAYLEAL